MGRPADLHGKQVALDDPVSLKYALMYTDKLVYALIKGPARIITLSLDISASTDGAFERHCATMSSCHTSIFDVRTSADLSRLGSAPLHRQICQLHSPAIRACQAARVAAI